MLSRLISAAEREAILGDLTEDAAYRGIDGTRLRWWLAGQCASIAFGLSILRVREWFVVPPMREVCSGMVADGRGALRAMHPVAACVRAVIFCGSMATIVLGVEVLVSALLRAF